MKYYRVIKSGYDVPKGTAPIGKILPENFKATDPSWGCTIGQFVDMSPEDFQEVSEEEYLKQEGKMDKLDKLISGEYYTVIESGNIFRYDKDSNASYYLGNYNTRFVRNGGSFDSDISAYRKATKEEIEWLEECNKQDKFIKFDEFKKQINKKIIGYKLIKPEYKNASENIMGVTFSKNLHVSVTSCIASLKEAGVLDLWFEPILEPEFKVGDWIYVINGGNGALAANDFVGQVCNKSEALKLNYSGEFKDCKADLYVKNQNKSYGLCKGYQVRKATLEEIKKVQVPDITINGYKAEFFNTHVQFGCACISKTQFQAALTLIEIKSPYSNRDIELVTIGKGTFNKDQIKQIVEYYKNN